MGHGFRLLMKSHHTVCCARVLYDSYDESSPKRMQTSRFCDVSLTRCSSDRFPVINNLIQKTNLKKRRDALILGGVIALCIIVLLLYAFS